MRVLSIVGCGCGAWKGWDKMGLRCGLERSSVNWLKLESGMRWDYDGEMCMYFVDPVQSKGRTHLVREGD